MGGQKSESNLENNFSPKKAVAAMEQNNELALSVKLTKSNLFWLRFESFVQWCPPPLGAFETKQFAVCYRCLASQEADALIKERMRRVYVLAAAIWNHLMTILANLLQRSNEPPWLVPSWLFPKPVLHICKQKPCISMLFGGVWKTKGTLFLLEIPPYKF